MAASGSALFCTAVECAPRADVGSQLRSRKDLLRFGGGPGGSDGAA